MKKIFQAFILTQVVLYSALASATTPTTTPTTTKCTCGNGSPAADGCKPPYTGCYRHGQQCDTLRRAKGKTGYCKK